MLPFHIEGVKNVIEYIYFRKTENKNYYCPENLRPYSLNGNNV